MKVDVPEYDETISCANPMCVYAKAEPVVGLHGVLGGSIGPYTVCSLCGELLTKSYDKDLCDSHDDPEELEARRAEAIEQGTEIEHVEDNQTGGTSGVDERSGGALPRPRE